MRLSSEDLLDALNAAKEAEWDCDDDIYYQGCSVDDTKDSRGQPLRPYYNEGGEPYWM